MERSTMSTEKMVSKEAKLARGQIIYFYRQDKKFGEFSNFFFAPIYLKNVFWRTTEHYFQAQKFAGTHYEEEIRLLKTPGEAAQKGRDRSLPLRKDWEEVKEDIMREALYEKFTQYPELKELLLSTKDAILIEHTKNDNYWGDGWDGSGKNRLGILLMELREKLRSQS